MTATSAVLAGLLVLALVGIVVLSIRHRARLAEQHRRHEATAGALADMRRAREQADGIIDAAVESLILIDTRGVIQRVNPATEALFGYSAADLLGRNVSILVPEPLASQHDDYIRRYLETGEARVVGNTRELMARRRDGSILPIELSVNEIVVDGQRVFSGLVRDRSQRREIESRLEQARDQLMDAIETVPDGFVLYDAEDRLVICNARYREIYADSADLIRPGTRFEDIIREGVRRRQYAEAIGREEEWIAERMYQHLNPGPPIEQRLGNGRWLRIEERNTRSGGIVGFRIDITELKRREQDLRAREAQLRATIDSALDCVVVMDSDGVIVEFNPAAEATFGFSREAVIGCRMADYIVPRRYRAAHREGLRRFLATGEGRVLGRRFEIEAQRADGEEFPIELAISVAEDEGPLFVAYLRDITQRRRAEVALKEARDQAEAASRAKSDFLAMMSHEIRTPLNGVLGVLGLLKETSLDDDQRSFVSTGRRSAEALMDVINDILDFSKMEAGKLELESVGFDLDDVLDTTIEILSRRAEEKGIGLTHVVQDDMPRQLIGDPGRIRQVLFNLVGNAVKFTQRGHVNLSVTALPCEPGNCRVRFEVADTGPGIAEADKDSLFEEFVTLAPSRRDAYAGTGLGLAISKRLVTLMNGTIGFTSTRDVGSTFWFELPLNPESAEDTRRRRVNASVGADADDAADDVLRGLRVLLAEDNQANQLVVRLMLEKAGMAVDVAANGLEALSAVRHRPYDLVLMDINMPEMDGLEAAQAIRALPPPVGDLPIIAMTAHVLRGDRETILEKGLDDYLGKPLSRGRLFERIRAWAPRRSPAYQGGDATPDTATPADSIGPGDTALLPVVDDEVLTTLAADTDPSLVAELVGAFLDNLRERARAMEQARQDGELADLSHEAHSLKGSAGTFGALRLSARCADLERAAHQANQSGSADDAAHAKALAERLAPDVAAVERAMEDYLLRNDPVMP